MSTSRFFKTWLAYQHRIHHDSVAIVTMDGFVSFKCAATEELPQRNNTHGFLSHRHLAGNTIDEHHMPHPITTQSRHGRVTDLLVQGP